MTRLIRGVLLDVDDTLVDTRAAFRAAVGAVSRAWLPHLDAEGRGAAAEHWVLDAEQHFGAYTRGELTFTEQRRRRVASLHARFGGAELDDAEFDRWGTAYEAAFEAAWRACADAVALLDVLAAAGLPVGAVTNAAAAYQRRKLAAVGLADRVPVLVGVDELGVGKPDPRVFALGCSRLGLPADEIAYVGDELDVDARGARDAGLLGIWLDRHGTGSDPGDVPVARTLDDVPALLTI